MADVTLRAPTLDDAGAAAAVINSVMQRLRARDDVDEHVVHGWWTQPGPFDLERDVVLAVRGREVVGYGDLHDQGHDGSMLWRDVRGEGLGELHAEVERRALGRLSPGGVVRAVADERDEAYRELLASRGYVRIRSSYRMGIELEGRTFDARWPEDARVRSGVEGADEPLLHALLQQAFADHWSFTPTPYEEFLHWLREGAPVDPSLWLVAEVAGAPAGVAMCRASQPGKPDQGWVDNLGVLPEFRGRGLGTALLVHGFAELSRKGCRRVGLGVDAENTTGAVRLYEHAGMSVVERSDTWERRP
ncbi:MAG TPA: GNAT family N-acetyltransferase [Gaiella sp.]|nr:GNAT family N-acetyltransferase [Gaiella sp.]